jgi:hypothetical protein
MRRPSLMAATAALSITALFFSIGGAGYAANGGAFILGVINGAIQRTFLGANFNGTALQINNTSTAASAVPLQLTAATGHPPMKVNTAVKVTNLNADYLDGLDSTVLTRVHNVPYNPAPGAVSAPISLPANRPVHLVGVNQIGGVGQASLLRSSGSAAGSFLEWVSFSYNDPTISEGVSYDAGTKIVNIGILNTVSVETAGPSTIRVHNFADFTVSGSVSLMW